MTAVVVETHQIEKLDCWYYTLCSRCLSRLKPIHVFYGKMRLLTCWTISTLARQSARPRIGAGNRLWHGVLDETWRPLRRPIEQRFEEED